MNWNYVLQHPNWPDAIIAVAGLAFIAFVAWLWLKHLGRD